MPLWTSFGQLSSRLSVAHHPVDQQLLDQLEVLEVLAFHTHLSQARSLLANT